jgi:hypothetical protein
MPPLSAPKPNPYVDTRLAVISKSTTKSPAPHEVLAVVGDLLRRPSVLRGAVVESELAAALSALRPSEVVGALAQLDVTTCEESLTRAAAEAFDAAFADSIEERDLFAEAALLGLLVRDRVESVVFAARRFASETGDQSVVDAVRASDAQFAVVDRALTQKHARSLTGINAERRSSFDELDPEARERAVWFSACLDADGLLHSLAVDPTEALPSGIFPALVPGTAAAVQRDVESSSLPSFTAKQPNGGAMRFDDAESSALYRVTLGTASAAERAFLEQRARADADLAVAIREASDSDSDSDSDTAPID